MKETKKVKEKTLAKEKLNAKGNIWKKQNSQEAAGHNSGPPKQTYYCGSGLLMDYPFENFWVLFFYLVLIRHPI